MTKRRQIEIIHLNHIITQISQFFCAQHILLFEDIYYVYRFLSLKLILYQNNKCLFLFLFTIPIQFIIVY